MLCYHLKVHSAVKTWDLMSSWNVLLTISWNMMVSYGLPIVQTLCERSPAVAPMAVVVSVTKVTDNCLPNGGSSIVLIGDTNMIILGWRSTAATQACSPQHPAPSPLVLLTLISSHIMSHHSHPPVHVF